MKIPKILTFGEKPKITKKILWNFWESQVLDNLKNSNNFSSSFHCRNVEPAIWYETEVKLFEIQRV